MMQLVTFIAALILVLFGVIGQVLEWVGKLDNHPFIKKFVEAKVLRVALLIVTLLLLSEVFIDLNEVREGLNHPPPAQKPPLPLTAQDLCPSPAQTPPSSKPSSSKAMSGGIKIHGSVTQKGQINQIGPNSQATINPDVNPNQPVKVYFCNGNWRTEGPGQNAALEVNLGGDTKDFEAMGNLNNTGKYLELLTYAQGQIKDKPEWLTPYLMSGLAYLALGDKAKAQEMLNYYDKKAGPGYDDCKYIADHLREAVKRP